jgi:peptidoglycan/xylan/chitin deacetylase (PgdA/CDA1 family)
MEKEALAIHDINFPKQLFNFPLENYTLTFDDGLFSQYYYWPILRTIKTRKILFISTDLIDAGPIREQFKIRKPEYLNFPDTFESMKLYKTNGIKSNYMRIEELKVICETLITQNIEIGGHGHKHYYISDYGEIEKEKKMTEDTELMLEWFAKNLNIFPSCYAYPHYEYDEVLESVIKKFGISTLIGKRKQFEDEKLTFKYEG